MLHIKKIKPMFTSIVTTADKYEKDEVINGLLQPTNGKLKFYQKVIAIGPMVRGIQEGDTVMINPANYEVRKYDKNSLQNDMDNNKVIRYEFNYVVIDDENGVPKECLLLQDRDILYTFEGEERPETLMQDKPKLII